MPAKYCFSASRPTTLPVGKSSTTSSAQYCGKRVASRRLSTDAKRSRTISIGEPSSEEANAVIGEAISRALSERQVRTDCGGGEKRHAESKVVRSVARIARGSSDDGRVRTCDLTRGAD